MCALNIERHDSAEQKELHLGKVFESYYVLGSKTNMNMNEHIELHQRWSEVGRTVNEP